MLLKFRVETRKIKQPRIVVLRLSQDETGKPLERSLGSFNSKRSYQHIIEQLTEAERYEFDNYVATLAFSKTLFNTEADKVDRFIIKAAPDFKEALFAIWEEAKQWGITFTPEHEMLIGLLEKAKAVEQELSILTQGHFSALQKYGINIHQPAQDKENSTESEILFVTALKTARTGDRLAELFNEIASQKYGKSPKFKPHHFDFFINAKGKSTPPSFPKWYYTVAIDVLLELGIAPETLIPPELITIHWLRLNKQADILKTAALFDSVFPALRHNTRCHRLITREHMNSDIERMAKGKKYLSPAKAFEKWLEESIALKSSPRLETVISTFNRAFPALADNPFFMKLIASNLEKDSRTQGEES
ncbi:MAG: hypothetical protein HKM04_05650 [Legionellales bacterium]|nr:hypothetical protein [Legionellales bacterium]